MKGRTSVHVPPSAAPSHGRPYYARVPRLLMRCTHKGSEEGRWVTLRPGWRWNVGCQSWRISAPTGNTAVECRQIRLRATSPPAPSASFVEADPPGPTGKRRDVHRILIPAGLYFSISPRFLRSRSFYERREILTRLRGEMRRNVETRSQRETAYRSEGEIRPRSPGRMMQRRSIIHA